MTDSMRALVSRPASRPRAATPVVAPPLPTGSGAWRSTRSVVVMPTYQEAENVVAMLTDLMASPARPEVLIVDDASPDGTADLAGQVAASFPGRIHVLRRQGERGLGRAYRDGFAWALKHDYDVIVQMDADGSHPVSVLPRMISAVTLGSDVAIGSRYVDGGAIEDWPASRRALSRGGNTFARVALRLPQHDVTGAYRAWSRTALAACAFEESRVSGYGFMIEMADRMCRAQMRVEEVPIIFRDRRAGSSKMSYRIAFETLRMVLAMRYSPWEPGTSTLESAPANGAAAGGPGVSVPQQTATLQATSAPAEDATAALGQSVSSSAAA